MSSDPEVKKLFGSKPQKPCPPESCDAMISLNVRTMDASAKLIQAFLESHGIRTWICTDMKAGDDFREAIVKAVKSCKFFIPLINAEWASSGECKDEYHLAKRLNLTSHESRRTCEGEARLPALLPIAFLNLVFEAHPHVELLAANTNFLVHKHNSVLEGNTALLLSRLAASINAFKMAGFTLPTFDDSGLAKSEDTSAPADDMAQKAAHFAHDVAVQLSQLSKQMLEVQTSIASLQQRDAAPASAAGHSGPPQVGAREIPNFNNPWKLSQVAERYLGMSLEFGWQKILNTWSLEFMFEEKKDIDAETAHVKGRIRWSLLAIDPRAGHDPRNAVRKKDIISNNWQADELFEGTLHKLYGKITTKTHALGKVTGNACTSPETFIGMCDYYIVLADGGNSLLATCKYAGKSIDDKDFFGGSLVRAVAF
eukprot:m.21973 g.21973  ORF g.21973 m.21973 type:complete len:426 (-) comp10815_c0_seq1:40-1317(-)